MGNFDTGNLLFIPKYEFENDSEPHDKLLLILHDDDKELSIIFSLITSQEKHFKIHRTCTHGCYNLDEYKTHFYLFDKNIEVGTRSKTNTPFKFDSDSYLNIKAVNTINTTKFIKYRGTIVLLAKLHAYELTSIYKCICDSKYALNSIKTTIKDKIIP